MKRLGVTGKNQRVTISGVGKELINSQISVNLRIKSRINVFNAEISCLSLQKITKKLPQNFLSVHDFKIPSNIILADPNFNIPAEIDLLIGADLFWKSICPHQIKANASFPMLQKTLFGWIVAGSVPVRCHQKETLATFHVALHNDYRRASSYKGNTIRSLLTRVKTSKA